MKNEIIAVLNEYNSLGINQQLDYDKFYLYSIITHSTAIEGSTITEIENQVLFDNGISCSKPISEQFMNLDLKKAYEQSFDFARKHEKITVGFLCSLSGTLMKNIDSSYNTVAGSFSSAKGELRPLNVSAGRGGKSYLASIHPWADGNGRMDRLLMNMFNHHIKNLKQQIEEYKRSL